MRNGEGVVLLVDVLVNGDLWVELLGEKLVSKVAEALKTKLSRELEDS